MAKYPKFGGGDSGDSGSSFKLPKFTAPAAPTPKTVAVKIASQRGGATPVKAPTVKPVDQLTQLQQGNVMQDIGTGLGIVAEQPVIKPIISAASAIFNTLGMPLSWFNGYNFAQASENNSGIITTDDIRDAAFQGRKINGQEVKITGMKDGQPTYNIQPTVTDRAEIERINVRRRQAGDLNATAWTRGEATTYGGDVMREWGLSTAPGFLGISEADAVGFARDLALDPINFVPFGALGAGIKATGKATSGAYDAMKLAARGQVSQKVAKSLGIDAGVAGKIVSPPATVSPKFQGLGGKAAERVQQAKGLLDEKLAYKTTLVDPTSNPIIDNIAVIGSGIEAGYKALASSLVRSNLDSFLSKYAKRDVTRKGVVRTQIVEKAANDFRVLSGNGEEMGRATTYFQAKELSARIKLGETAAGLAIKTADDVTKALNAVEREIIVPAEAQNAPTAKLPDEAGESATIEAYTPYQTKDGKWWVYDGEKVYRTTTEDDANRLIDALLWTEKEIEAAVVTKAGKGYQVRAGEQVFPAKTKGEAEAIAKAYNEQTLPAAIARTRAGAVTDTAPRSLPLAEILKVPTNTEEGKAVKAILSKLDKVSAKATGTKAVYKAQVKERIKDIIRSSEALTAENKILAATNKEQLQALKEALAGKDSNPFALFEIDLNGTALKTMLGKVRVAIPGEDPAFFSTLVAKYKTWKPGNPPAAVKVGIENELANFIKRIEAVKKSGAEKLGPDQKYQLVKSEFGEEVADALNNTGIFENFASNTPAGKAAASKAVASFNAVIDGLLEKATSVKFTGIEDLIAQSKAGVVVDEDSLKQIFKLIDPNNNIVAKADDAVVKDGSIYMYNELFKSEGAKTIQDMQVQLTHLGDFDNLLKLSGISDDLLLAQLIKDLRAPEGNATSEFVINATAQESKQAMASRIGNKERTVEYRAALEGIAEANAETFAKLQSEILTSPEAQIDVLDSFGKVVSRSTKEQYATGSQAIQNRVFNQVRERKLLNVITGTIRADITRGGKALDRQLLLDKTIESMNIASDSLGLMDIRITAVKFRADEDYVAAFEKAKKAKKAFDISREGNFAYLHMGDILQVLKDAGANDLLLDSFFPKTLPGRAPSKNYLSWTGLSDAARQALELRSKSKAIDVDQLTARILNGGLNADNYSAAFKARYEGYARSLAEYLAREDVLEGLSAAHLSKSLGVAERWVNSAESVSNDLQNLLYQAWEANTAFGEMDDMARVAMIRSYMRKVLYVSDVFRIEGGPIAESAIKAVSNMMLKKGLIRTPDSVDETTKLLGDAEAAAFRKIINTMYLYEKPQFAMKPGQTKFPTTAQAGKIQNRLVEAEENFANVMRRADEQYSTDPKVKTQFRKDRVAAQGKLDSARLAAIENGIETRHYSGRNADIGKDPWVPTDKYNYELETRAAQRKLLNYESAKAGLKARENFIADTRPVMPKATILTGKRRDEFLKKQNVELANIHVENASSRIRNANQGVDKLIDNQHYENLGATPEEAAEMYFQRSIADGMVANTETKVEFPGEANILLGTTRYGAQKAETGVDLTNVAAGGGVSERGYGLSKSRRDVAAIGRRRETMYHKITDRYANLLRGMSTVLRNVPSNVIEDAFTLIKRGEVISADAAPDLIRAYTWMERAWKPLIASVENALSTQRGYNGDMLADAMRKMGLTEKDGFLSPAGLTAEELPNYYRQLPFGEFDLPSGVAPDSDEARVLKRKFDENKQLLQSKQQNPLITMLRLMQASQNVVYQKGLAEDFIARFSYKAEGLSYKQALDKGYVKLETVFGGESLLKYLPDPENGGLFPPELAKQFFSLNREYNQMFDSVSSQQMQKTYFEGIMTVVGAFKASQTILVPRHHVTNLLGDMSTAMIRGAVNPAHWGAAARIATKFAVRRAGAEYFMKPRLNSNPDEMDRLFTEMFRSFNGEGRVLQGVENGQKVNGIVVYEKGVPVRKNLSDDDLTNLFEDWGIIEESIFQQDTQGLVDYLDRDGLGGQDLSTAKKILKGFRTGVRAVTKAPGDLAAGYGNIPRVAHALKLMQGRSWNSLEQALDTVANEIALFHPTAKSLAATERQWGRFVTTYYTWMRMAQVGMLRMIGENAPTVLGIQKTLYAWNREQMGEENRPANIGVSYGGDLNKLPSYITSTSGVGRISGENLQGILQATGLSNIVGNVPQTMRDTNFQFFFPLMYNDALNYWRMDFDPYRDAEAEFWSSVSPVAERGMNPGILGILGKNVSLIGEPLVMAMYGIDPATGQKIELKQTSDFFNLFVGSNIGLAKPVQAWVDPNLPEADKFIGRFRSLVGLGLADPNTESNKKNAENQFNYRTKEFLDQILKQEGAPAPGSMLSDRLAKVIEDLAKNQGNK